MTTLGSGEFWTECMIRKNLLLLKKSNFSISSFSKSRACHSMPTADSPLASAETRSNLRELRWGEFGPRPRSFRPFWDQERFLSRPKVQVPIPCRRGDNLIHCKQGRKDCIRSRCFRNLHISRKSQSRKQQKIFPL